MSELTAYRLEAPQNGNFTIVDSTPEIIIKAHHWVQTTTGVAGHSAELRAGNAIDFLVKIRFYDSTERMKEAR